MTTEIFTEENKQTEELVIETSNTSSVEIPSVPSELSNLVGEGKKFKTLNDLIKSFEHKESHISKIESENATYREELAKRKAAEELVAQLKQEQSIVDVDQQSPKGIDLDQVAQIVENVINKKTTEQQMAVNAKQVVDGFTSVYGEKAKEKYLSLADEVGMSVDQLDMLARKSPKMLLKLANIEKTPPTQSGKVGGDVFPPTGNNGSLTNDIKLKGNSTKDVTNAMKAAREAVLSQYTKEQLTALGLN